MHQIPSRRTGGSAQEGVRRCKKCVRATRPVQHARVTQIGNPGERQRATITAADLRVLFWTVDTLQWRMQGERQLGEGVDGIRRYFRQTSMHVSFCSIGCTGLWTYALSCSTPAGDGVREPRIVSRFSQVCGPQKQPLISRIYPPFLLVAYHYHDQNHNLPISPKSTDQPRYLPSTNPRPSSQ